jgi:hypothetical protein
MAAASFAALLLSHIAIHDDRISGAKLFGLALGISDVVLAYVLRFQLIRDVGSTFISQVAPGIPRLPSPVTPRP